MRRFELVKNAPSDTKLPDRKTKDSAGYDFYLPCDVVIKPHGFSKIINMNVKAIMNEGDVLKLYIRSSVGLVRHVTLANGTGIIDADYANNPQNDGNIGLVLQNNSDKWQRFKKGERVMQGVFQRYLRVDNDATTGERKGGIGSTNRIFDKEQK